MFSAILVLLTVIAVTYTEGSYVRCRQVSEEALKNKLFSFGGLLDSTYVAITMKDVNNFTDLCLTNDKSAQKASKQSGKVLDPSYVSSMAVTSIYRRPPTAKIAPITTGRNDQVNSLAITVSTNLVSVLKPSKSVLKPVKSQNGSGKKIKFSSKIMSSPTKKLVRALDAPKSQNSLTGKPTPDKNKKGKPMHSVKQKVTPSKATNPGSVTKVSVSIKPSTTTKAVKSKQPSKQKVEKVKGKEGTVIRITRQCHQKGTVVGANFVRICTECAVTTVLPTTFFPRYINEVKCTTKSQGQSCFQGEGSCTEVVMSATFLKKASRCVPKKTNDGKWLLFDEWKPFNRNIVISCKCMLKEKSKFVHLLK